jgi:hypothetical protein
VLSQQAKCQGSSADFEPPEPSATWVPVQVGLHNRFTRQLFITPALHGVGIHNTRRCVKDDRPVIRRFLLKEFDGIKSLFAEYQTALKKVYTVPNVPDPK